MELPKSNFYSLEKIAIRNAHALDIFIKRFGKSADYINRKVSTMWKAIKSFEMMNLGCNVFKITFRSREDLKKFLK